jgi:hypothetical protein
MPRRTQVFQLLPWQGGLNSSVPLDLMPPGDLQLADNVLYSTNGLKIKREGFDAFDALSDIPAVLSRSSSGTTRTVVFASSVNSVTVEQLVVGEGITVSSTAGGVEAASYSGNWTVATITTTNVTNDTITFTAGSSLTEGSTNTSTLSLVRQHAIVHLTDYWRFTGSVKAQQVVAVTSQPKVFYYDMNGRRKQATGTYTARPAAAARANSVVFNEKLVIFQDGTGNTPLVWDGTALADLSASAPDASFGTVWLARIWTNDKSDLDRLHYSATGDETIWLGESDSGAINIYQGDGDPYGVTAAFPYKTGLQVAKRGKHYRIVGDSPENFLVEVVSDGLGIEAQGTVAPIDQEEVLFVSSKGIHSVGATASYGDVATSYLSLKVQEDFNAWQAQRLQNSQMIYIDTLNAVALTVAETDSNFQDNLWFFSITQKEWFRWPSIDCQAIAKINVSGRNKLFIATKRGKIIETQNGTFKDYDSTAIRYRLQTGRIYPDNSPGVIKAFKRLYLYFKPVTSYSFTARVRIDSYSEQILGFSGIAQGDPLGTEFMLGQSILGTDLPFGAHSVNIDGYGYGIIVEIEQAGTDEKVDIYGLGIEYEVTDISKEVLGSGGA